MSISETDICNLALSKLGLSTIGTIMNPESHTERVCALWYHPCREDLLRQHTWNFATKKIIPEYDPVAKAYRLPADYIRFAMPATYEIRGNYLYPLASDFFDDYAYPYSSLSTPCYFEYVWNCTKTDRFDSLFVTCLYLWLAHEMCSELKPGDSNLKDRIFNQLLSKKPEAKSVDSQDSRKLRAPYRPGILTRGRHHRIGYLYRGY